MFVPTELETRVESRRGDIMADATGAITAWGTVRTFLEVGT
jgi:hypothetical protein